MYLFSVIQIMLFKNLITVFFLVISLVSCTSTNELIKQERIHKGMTKSSLWDSMLDVPPNEDITWPNCYRAFYPDKQFEILSSPSMNMFFVFEEVTIQSNPSNCEAQGNGYLFGYYNSFEDAIAVISSVPLEDINTNRCPSNYDKSTWINSCIGTYVYSDGAKYVGEFENGNLHGKGTFINQDCNGSEFAEYVGDYKYGEPHGQGRFTLCDGDQYIGELKNGERHGQGTHTSRRLGLKYVGEWENSKKHGQGTFTTDLGYKYIGQWENDEEHGLGTKTYASGSQYTGNFENGKKHGQGKYTFSDGSQYIGEYENDAMQGQGTFTFADGVKYMGEWENGKIHGYGKQSFNDNSQYVGEFENGAMQGQGTITFSNGSQYAGEWENDAMQGQGTFTSADGSQYVGEWENGKKDGYGKQSFNDNSQYAGEWENGAMHGQGTINLSDGSQYAGEWENDKRHGQGTYTSASGSQYVGEWKNDEIISKNINANKGLSELIEASSGTGFAVSYLGHIVTNEHVINACERINVRNTENVTLEAEVIAIDERNDLAVLKADVEPLQILAISENNPEQLQNIFVAGFPWGERVSSLLTITDGMVTNPSGVGNNFANFTHNAAIQPGNSGGPIVNFGGNVVGVTVSKLDADSILNETGFIPENTNYGVKSNILLNLLESKGIVTLDTSSNDIKKSEMIKLLNESTYFISCEMTVAQIRNLQTKKVMYRNLLQ